MGEYSIFGVIGIVVTLISMIVCPIVAGTKGRSAVGWFFGGLLLGAIGLIVVCCLSNLNEETDRSFVEDDEDELADDFYSLEINELESQRQQGLISEKEYREKRRRMGL